jgi:hypothetical protein
MMAILFHPRVKGLERELAHKATSKKKPPEGGSQFRSEGLGSGGHHKL